MNFNDSEKLQKIYKNVLQPFLVNHLYFDA
jgi:hypothetical protein